MIPNENLIATEILVDEVATIHLRESSRWAKFLGVTGMVISILVGLIGVFAPMLFSSFSKYRYSSRSYSDSASMLGVGFISVMYILIAAVCFFISIFLYHFGAKMKRALQYTDQQLFNESLLNLKRYYRITGILTIIYLSFLVLVLLFGIIGALFSR